MADELEDADRHRGGDDDSQGCQGTRRDADGGIARPASHAAVLDPLIQPGNLPAGILAAPPSSDKQVPR